MARSLETILGPRESRIALPEIDEVIALLDRNGDVPPFDPSYGDTLSELLPRRLSELTTRH